MASTSRLTSSHSVKDPVKALHDPFGYGFEGRIGVDRETSARRKGIAAVLHQFAARGIKAPEAAQYDYLIAHGFYTVEELKEHPGRPTAKGIQTPQNHDSEGVERVAAVLADYVKEVDEDKWGRRSKRVSRWELIRRENPQKKPAPRAVHWAIQEPESGSESESDGGRAEVPESESESDEAREIRHHFRGGFGRGRDSGRGRGIGNGSGSGGRGRGRGRGHGIADDDDFAREVSDW